MDKEVGDPPVAPCDNCDKEDSHLRCSNCKSAYYCSADCQRKHWKNHKLDCKEAAKKLKEIEEESTKLENFSKRYDNTLGDGCSICYETVKSSEKLQLPCHHIFCTSCIGNYSLNTTKLNCPLCRKELNNLSIFQEVYSNVARFVHRAYRVNPRHSKELRLHYATIALEEYRRLESLINSIPKDQVNPSTRWMSRDMYMKILVVLEQFEEAFVVGESIISDPHFPANDIRKCAQVVIHLADCHIGLSQFEGCLEILTDLAKELGQKCVIEAREVFHRLIRVYYELEQYDKALLAARQAVYIDQNHENVYEYIVKSYVAKNDWTRALNTMKKAIRYESPWDAKNTAYLQDAYKQLQQEYEEYVMNTTSSADCIPPPPPTDPVE